MPFGTAVGQGFVNPVVSNFAAGNIRITKLGFFVYNGAPGPGNPPIFWVATGTKDPYGNTVTPTAGIQNTGTFNAGNTVTTPNGTFDYAPSPGANNLGNSSVPFNRTSPNTLVSDGHGNNVPQGETTFSFDAALTGGPYLALTNANGATTLYRATSQAGPWTEIVTLEFNDAGFFQPNAPIILDPWHTMALLNSWTSGGRVTPQYRLTASPPNTVEVIGSLTAPATIASGQAVWDLPAGYTVTNPQSVIARNQSTNAAVFFSITTGSPQALNYQAGAVSGNVIDFHSFISIDA